MNAVADGPRHEYGTRLGLRRAAEAKLAREEARLSYARLTTFGVALLLAALAGSSIVAWAWLLFPVVFFMFLVSRHDRITRAREAAARAIAFYDRGLARIEDRWIGTGERGDRFRDDQHLYANDLDLFGRGSLFELLSIAGTAAGEETLAAWLKRPADPTEVAARQQAIVELTPSLDLREALGRTGADVRAGVHSEALLAWAEGPPLLYPGWLRWVAVLLTVSVVGARAVLFTTGNQGPIVAVLVIQALFVWPQLRRTEHALHGAEGVTRDLDVLAHLLERVERETMTAPRLVRLQEQLRTGQVSASQAIRSLHRLVEI